MKRKLKGEYGYIAYKKKIELVKTIVLIVLSFATYYLGVLTTGSNKNLLTYVAVLGCLPMAKCAVNFILFTKAHSCSEDVKKSLDDANIVPDYFDLYLTTYKVNYSVSAAYYSHSCFVALMEKECLSDTATVSDAQEYLGTVMTNAGYSNITVKIFDDKDKFIERINELRKMGVEDIPDFLHDNIMSVCA